MDAMNSRQRRIKWETIFLLDYLEKQRRLSPEMALCVLRLAVVTLHELPGNRIAQSSEKTCPTAGDPI